MYESHWGLRESPFRGSPDPKFFYQGPTHDEALARLHFLVEDRRRLGLLLGGAGGGKSLLLQMFAGQLRRDGVQTAMVNLLGLDPRELLWAAAAQLGVNPAVDEPQFVLWRRVVDRLAENRYQQLNTALLFDDADQASSEGLSHVLRLLQGDACPEPRLTVVLAADPARVGLLGRRLLDLAELRIELEPWDEEDTRAYLQSSVAKAGGPAPVFDAPAESRLYQLTRGVPRHVSQLAELALLAGAGRRLPHIDQQTIDSVHQELGSIFAS